MHAGGCSLFKPGVLSILLQGLNAGGRGGLKLGLCTSHWMGCIAYMDALAYALLTYNMPYTCPTYNMANVLNIWLTPGLN